jgi:hypothetical protein
MSRVYVVRTAEVTRIVHVEDGVQAPIELLPILAPERMADLLAAELAALGFEREGNVSRRVSDDGTSVEVDLIAGTVTVKVTAEAEVKEQTSGRRDAGADQEATAKRLDAELARELEERVDDRTEALRRKATARLEARLADLRAELDGAVGRATVGALEEKARSLGEVESIVTDEAGNVTIAVKL